MNSFTFLLLFYLFLDKPFPDFASPRWRSNIQIRAENRSAAGRPGDDDRGLKSKNFKKRYTEGSNEDVKSGSVIVRQKGGMWSSEGGWVFANSGSNPPPKKKFQLSFRKTFFTNSNCFPHPSRRGWAEWGQTEEVSSQCFSFCSAVFNSELGRVVKMLRVVIFSKKKM